MLENYTIVGLHDDEGYLNILMSYQMTEDLLIKWLNYANSKSNTKVVAIKMSNWNKDWAARKTISLFKEGKYYEAWKFSISKMLMLDTLEVSEIFGRPCPCCGADITVLGDCEVDCK